MKRLQTFVFKSVLFVILFIPVGTLIHQCYKPVHWIDNPKSVDILHTTWMWIDPNQAHAIDMLDSDSLNQSRNSSKARSGT